MVAGSLVKCLFIDSDLLCELLVTISAAFGLLDFSVIVNMKQEHIPICMDGTSPNPILSRIL